MSFFELTADVYQTVKFYIQGRDGTTGGIIPISQNFAGCATTIKNVSFFA